MYWGYGGWPPMRIIEESFWERGGLENIALDLDEKWLVLLIKKYFWLVQYPTGYYLGPVLPPSTDGVSFSTFHQCLVLSLFISSTSLTKKNAAFKRTCCQGRTTWSASTTGTWIRQRGSRTGRTKAVKDPFPERWKNKIFLAPQKKFYRWKVLKVVKDWA